MDTRQIECIYCGRQETVTGRKRPWREHYLPKGLGRFRGFEPLWDRVCLTCNATIGQHEEQFLTLGPVGFIRYRLALPKRPPSKNPFYNGSHGAPPIRVVGRVPGVDHDVLIEPIWGSPKAELARQLILCDEKGTLQPVAVPEWVKQSDDLLKLMREKGLQGSTVVYFHSSDEEAEWLKGLIRGIQPQAAIQESELHFDETHVDLSASIQVNHHYFPAVAKIAFHYLLKVHGRTLCGTEPEFSGIRRFIMGETRDNVFVRELKTPWFGNFRLGMRPKGWRHILQANRVGPFIRVFCHFFAGPGDFVIAYEINVGRDPTRIYRGRDMRAQEFIYYDEPAADGLDGEMREPEHLLDVVVSAS